ncbi:DUF4253 domain-containing protein [Actinomycetospora atypica]|uniref:DUF4253 domain-containing protein n=1 Tax=Actinomycetospora atypica TaxID=1290095 RepID=A0ABV9YHJ8_9PSEU
MLLYDATLERCGWNTVGGDQAHVDADPYEVLAGWWPGPCLPDCPCDEPLAAEFPPLARTGEDLSQSPATFASASGFVRAVRELSSLAVVQAGRPADVPLALQWSGACNYASHDLARLTAVLRSWEERFGALVLFMAPDTLLLSVARPPRRSEECRSVAAEHLAFCPDQIDPQTEIRTRPLTLSEYADSLRGEPLWRFWWD